MPCLHAMNHGRSCCAARSFVGFCVVFVHRNLCGAGQRGTGGFGGRSHLWGHHAKAPVSACMHPWPGMITLRHHAAWLQLPLLACCLALTHIAPLNCNHTSCTYLYSYYLHSKYIYTHIPLPIFVLPIYMYPNPKYLYTHPFTGQHQHAPHAGLPPSLHPPILLITHTKPGRGGVQGIQEVDLCDSAAAGYKL